MLGQGIGPGSMFLTLRYFFMHLVLLIFILHVQTNHLNRRSLHLSSACPALNVEFENNKTKYTEINSILQSRDFRHHISRISFGCLLSKLISQRILPLTTGGEEKSSTVNDENLFSRETIHVILIFF